ncbi:type III-A CRISPR-associated RAMP protein Csm5, partial [Patescibacteria group bacterium]|nr:type III-A CRISPR-associated RAMP protein Csm5 [Patescibacteria group bacterium]
MLRKWIVTLRTLSPIHIKGQRPDYGMGIIVLDNRPRIGYIVDEKKWADFLMQNQKYLKDYVQEFSDPWKFKKKGINDFLRERGLLNENIVKQISSKITAVGDGNTFICDGMGKYFIPGTSVKGAIRTSLLYHFLKELKDLDNENFRNTVVNKIEYKLEEYNKVKSAYINAKRRNDHQEAKRKRKEMDHIKKSFDEEIVKNEFLNFFNGLVKKDMVKVGPNTDLLRTVKVSDAKVNRIQRENIKVVCFRSNGSSYFGKTKKRNKPEREISLDYECLKKDTDFTTEILLDIELLSKFYPGGKMLFNDISSLINVIKDFGDRQWREEESFFQKVQGLQRLTDFYNQNISQSLLRVGWGTGMLG